MDRTDTAATAMSERPMPEARPMEPVEETATPPPPPRLEPEAEPYAGAASSFDLGPPVAAPDPWAPPPGQLEEPLAAAPEEEASTVEEAERQLPAAAAPPLQQQPPPPQQQKGGAALPPPSQERAAAVEADNRLPDVPAAAAPPQQQEREGGAAEEASSVREEEKDAAPVRAQEGGGEKPEEKPAAPAMAQDAGRRRWRQIQAAVRLIFLPCKRAPRGGDQSTPRPPPSPTGKQQPASGREEKKPTPADEGATTKPPASEQGGEKPTPADEAGRKPPAPDDGKQPASGQEQQVATPPPPAETSPPETAAAAAEAWKPLAAPPSQKQEGGGAPEHASSVQEEEKGAAPATAAQDGEEKPPARRRWRLLWSASNLLFLRPKPKDGEGELAKPSAPASGKKKEKKPAAAPKPQGEESTGGVPDPDKAGVKEKDEGQGGKRGRHDASQGGAVAGGDGAAGPEGTPAGKTTAPPAGSLMKRFQKAGKRLMRIMSWYREHRSSRVGGEPEAAAAPPMGEGKGDGIKAPDMDKGAAAAGTKPEEEEKPKPPHPKWPREEERLEQILEEAFTRLLAAEFHQLRPIRKKCLLTFSVFELAAEVKKQAMVYWWVAKFNLRHRGDQSPSSDDAAAPAATETTRRRRRRSCWQQARKSKAAPPASGNQSPTPPPQQQQGNKAADDGGGNNPDAAAEGIFSELSSHGFLEPMKNWCSRTIHGCKVNPLVHWMVKRRARDDRFAVLNVNGRPANLQHNSGILCLTADNRPLLQKLRMEDELQQAGTGNKPKAERTPSSSLKSPTQDKAPEKDPKNAQPLPSYDEIVKLFEGKEVILNINAHVYPVSKSTFLHLADCLVVLQLGRWCNLDNDTYMEVDDLESLHTIGLLKNLRYLSLRGLSRLMKLPIGIRSLKKLAILDMRGCQNLVDVASNITTPLKQLTHLDLTECYMLEYIGRGINSLSELQVFKGFVFATGTQRNTACRLQDLRRLKKLQKLTVSITTDANVGKGEMAELRHLASLRKLTITWSEIPSILDGDSEMVEKRGDLIDKWTGFELPQELLKLDLRCYPKNEVNLIVDKNLMKLYLRGGDLVKFSINESNSIKTLRLRYLKDFNMEWEEIRSKLKDIEYVEIVSKDEKLMKDVDKDQTDKNMEIKDQEDNNIDMKDQKDAKEECKFVKQKKIMYSTLDENGVWVKDKKEEENLRIAKATKEKEAHGTMESSKGATENLSPKDENPSTKDASTITYVNRNDNSNAIREQSGLSSLKTK